MTMTEEAAKQLRAPFPESAIGKLPRVTCKDCSGRGAQCTKHEKRKCQVCEQYISTAHIHLDFVGHAATTDRLLQVDPAWTWEPASVDECGMPLLDQNGGLWIKLTICGVTRLGYGDADGKSGGSAVKEAIGDAIRNAAMRFGVALDLWSKGDLQPPEEAPAEPAPQPEDPDLAALRTEVINRGSKLHEEAKDALKAWVKNEKLTYKTKADLAKIKAKLPEVEEASKALKEAEEKPIDLVPTEYPEIQQGSAEEPQPLVNLDSEQMKAVYAYVTGGKKQSDATGEQSKVAIKAIQRIRRGELAVQNGSVVYADSGELYPKEGDHAEAA